MSAVGCRADCHVESFRTGKEIAFAPSYSGFPEGCVKSSSEARSQEKERYNLLLTSATVREGQSRWRSHTFAISTCNLVLPGTLAQFLGDKRTWNQNHMSKA